MKHDEQITDIDIINQFFAYLKDKNKGIGLSPIKAFHVIYYLQEHIRVISDTIEMCSVCNSLYDSEKEGYHSEKSLKFYCGEHEYKAPELKNSDNYPD